MIYLENTTETQVVYIPKQPAIITETLAEKIEKQEDKDGSSCDYLFPDYEWYLDVHDAPIDKGKEVFMKLYKNRLRGKK